MDVDHDDLQRWRSERRMKLASQGYVGPDADRIIADEEEQRACVERHLATQRRTPIDIDEIGHGPRLNED